VTVRCLHFFFFLFNCRLDDKQYYPTDEYPDADQESRARNGPKTVESSELFKVVFGVFVKCHVSAAERVVMFRLSML